MTVRIPSFVLEQNIIDVSWANLDPSSRLDKVVSYGKKILKICAVVLFGCTIIGIPVAVAILRDPEGETHKADLAFLRGIKEQRESHNVC